MYQYKGIDDTIVAISTAQGQGGIGIVRMSGSQAVTIAEKIFKSTKNKEVSSLKSHTVHYGWINDKDDVVDEVLLTLMRKPNSYTKEDVVEISCHGGTASLKTILNVVLDEGARLAEPGEFTKRAFLNGRIDLTQAEAVLDIIHSKTESFLRVSSHQLKGDLSKTLDEIRGGLLSIYTEIEAVVNFPEDEIDSEGFDKIKKDIERQHEAVKNLLTSSDHGRILKEGIKLVLCGKPNVGKSSLLNVLLKEPRAIVSDIEGTTRDTIEETAQIKGIPFKLVDTAGFLNPRDEIEKEAIGRSRSNMQGADLVLLMLDSNRGIEAEDEKLLNELKSKEMFVLVNKIDLDKKINNEALKPFVSEDRILNISATGKQGINELEERIVNFVWKESNVDTHGIMISNVRHIQSLKECKRKIAHSLDSLNKKLSFEFVSEDVKGAVNDLDQITGRNIDADLMDTIFSQFCIGK